MTRVVTAPFTEPFSRSTSGTVEAMISLNHAGRVHFQATSWPARLCSRHLHAVLLPGDPVAVVGRDGITLLVTPVQSALPLGFPATVPLPSGAV